MRLTSLAVSFVIVVACLASAGCRSASNLVGLTDEPEPVDLDAWISKKSEAYNPYQYDSLEAREWIEKAFALCSRIYPPTSADGVEARFRVLRDADGTGKGKERKDLRITKEEAEQGFRKTFARYADALGDHPLDTLTFSANSK